MDADPSPFSLYNRSEVPPQAPGPAGSVLVLDCTLTAIVCAALFANAWQPVRLCLHNLHFATVHGGVLRQPECVLVRIRERPNVGRGRVGSSANGQRSPQASPRKSSGHRDSSGWTAFSWQANLDGMMKVRDASFRDTEGT